MKKTKNELIEHCKRALKNKVQYVYGAKMKVLSLQEIKDLRKRYGGYVWKSDLQKAGKMCCDCSGLISSCTGVLRGSSNYKDTALECVKIGEIKKNWEKFVGWGLWLKGHIGVVSDRYGYYYAMDGSARNMVHLPIEKNEWVYAIKLCDIDYSQEETKKKESDEMVTETFINVNGKVIKINRILKDGRNFIEVRGLENAGFEVGYDERTKAISLSGLRK